MPSRRRTRVAATLAGLSVAVGLTTAAAVLRHSPADVQVFFLVATVAFGAALALVGLLLTGVRPQNRLGPVLAVTGGVILAETALREYAYTVLTAVPGQPPAGAPLPEAAFWVSSWLDALWFPAGLTLVLLLFPRGFLPSRRWRVVAVPAVIFAVIAAIGAAATPGPLSVESYPLEVAWGTPDAVASWPGLVDLGRVAVVAGIALLLAAAASLVVRWRAAEGSDRQQLKPLVLVAAVMLITVPLQSVPALHDVMVVCFVLAVVVGLPGALAIGALRYRLWEIDPVLISLIVYGGLAVLATVAYGVAVLLVGGLVAGGTDGASAAELLPAVLAAAAAAVVFGQVRAWLTAFARRAVLGVRATPYEALATLPRRLADAEADGDADAALRETASALRLGLGVPGARVRARLVAGGALSAWSGERPDDERPDGELIVVPARHLGEEVGDVAVLPSADRQLSRADRRLLHDLAAQVAPALRALALNAELREQLVQIRAQAEELRASRRRLATAQFQERRRLERDLHDGAQQQLVAATVNVRGLQTLLAEGAAVGPEAKLALESSLSALDRCLDDLRELARGVSPPLLEARGLAAALRSRARTSPVPVRVEYSDAAESGRFEPVIESAVYFACLEAVQNVAKHAPGATAVLSLDVIEGNLVFTVTDDGEGFDIAQAALGTGTGLVGLQDRMAAVGGALTVTSAPGLGTVVRGVTPIHPVPDAAQDPS